MGTLEGAGWLAAFLLGLNGGVHCVAMCGGVVGALGLGVSEPRRRFGYLAAYNGGRVSSYVLAGLLVGGIGLVAANLALIHEGRRVLQLVAALFMIAVGLYLGGWWLGLSRIERIGARLWRHIEPLGRKMVPVRSFGHAFGLGLVWGWLPCGLVYTVLIWALSAGGPVEGALLLLAFGLGTAPNLIAMGFAATRVNALMHRPWVRRGAGAMVMAFGFFGIWRAVAL